MNFLCVCFRSTVWLSLCLVKVRSSSSWSPTNGATAITSGWVLLKHTRNDSLTILPDILLVTETLPNTYFTVNKLWNALWTMYDEAAVKASSRRNTWRFPSTHVVELLNKSLLVNVQLKAKNTEKRRYASCCSQMDPLSFSFNKRLGRLSCVRGWITGGRPIDRLLWNKHTLILLL